MNVGRGVEVLVTGAIQGTTNVQSGGLVIVEASGRLAGTLHNDGDVVVRGVFDGARSGSGTLAFEDRGYEKRPSIRGGIRYYEW